MSRPRVLLADDHMMFAKSLARLLAEHTEVVQTVGDGRALLTAAAESRPEVIVCDISMPELDGLEATRRLVQIDPDVKVVILSMHADVGHVRAAFRAGARAYVVKTAAPDELLSAIHEVLRGRYYTSPAVTGHLVGALDGVPAPDPPASGAAGEPPLTERERQVLLLVGEGCSNPEIADRLCLAETTVRSHLSHLYAKLGLSNRVKLALYAMQAGLVPREPL